MSIMMAAGRSLRTVSGPSSYVGPVATGCLQNDNFAHAGERYFQFRSPHIMRGTPSFLRPGLQLYKDNEAALGGTVTITEMTLEYPADTFQNFKFGGSNSIAGVATPSVLYTDDFTGTRPPNGATFWIRANGDMPGGIMSRYNIPEGAGAGLETSSSSPVTNKCKTGTVGTPHSPYGMSPVIILGDTTLPTVGFLGDSRSQGAPSETSTDTIPDVGQMARTLGPLYGYWSGAWTATSVSDYVNGNHALRNAMMAYCSHVVQAGFFNDLGGRTLGQMQADAATVAGYFPGVPNYLCTVWCSTASTTNWDDALHQTLTAGKDPTAFNTWARTVPSPFTGIIELADVCEGGRNTNKVRSNGTPFAYTGDGTHPTRALCELIRTSNIFPVFSR